MVEPSADDQPGGARGLARVDRPGRPLHRDRALAAVLRRVGSAEEGAHGHVGTEAHGLAGESAEFLPLHPLARFFAEPDGVGHGALDQHRVAVVGRVVVIARVQVVAREGLYGAVVVGVLRRGLGEGRVIEAAVGALDHLCAVVGRVGDPQREVVGVRHERVPGPDGHHLATRADADRPLSVVALLDGVDGAAGPVMVRGEVAGGVRRVVGVVEEVPAGDVVGIAVAVVVEVLAGLALRYQVAGRIDLAVSEGVDQVLRGDQRGGAGAPGVGEAHTRIFCVVVDVQDAVSVAVVRRARGAV